MNRRQSYASVAAGSVSRSNLARPSIAHASASGDSNSNPNSNPLSPTFGDILTGEPATQLPSSSTPEHPIVRLSNMQQPTHTSGGGHEGASVVTDGSVMHQHQHRFGMDWDNAVEQEVNMYLYGRHTTMGPSPERFIMPAYLQNTRYMRKLVDRQNVRDTARRESEAANGHHSHRPSRSSSTTNLAGHKMVPSHRGMTYEVIEARPPDTDSDVPPLPSRWSEGELDVSADGTGLKWPVSAASQQGVQFLSAQADHPMPTECGIYYFETRIDQMPEGSGVAVGVSGPKHDLKKLPGWEAHSWGWHGDDGMKFACACATTGNQYDKPFGKGDTVGCGLNAWTGTVFFTRNGHRLDDAFKDISDQKLYPAVGIKQTGVAITTNFGQEAFKYNIVDEIRREKDKVRAEIGLTKLSSVLSGRTEDNFVKELVAQFLRHGGYVETAKAFTSEVQTEHRALGTETTITGNAAVEDIDAAQRQRIRSAILAGDVDKAIQCTQDFYPEVLDSNPVILFRLKAMKFLEIVRLTCSSRQDTVPVSPLKKEKARATLPGNSTSNLSTGAMDLDDDDDGPVRSSIPSLPPTAALSSSINWPPETSEDYHGDADDHMETSISNIATGVPALQTSLQLSGNPILDLQTAILEGQKLSEEYDRDQRKDIRELMKHVKGIWAYEDPTRSKEVGYLFRQDERVKVAEELNGAILVSMGKSSVAAIERMAQQTEVLVEEITEQGQPGALINVEHDMS